MGDDKEVPSARKDKDSSLGRRITDSSQGDNTNNGDNDQDSKLNVRNKSMSSSSHGQQEAGRDQELGFPTSNCAETEVSSSDVTPPESAKAYNGINQEKDSGHRIEMDETEEEDGDKSSEEEEEEDDEDRRRLMLSKRSHRSQNRGNQSWSAIDYLKEVITAIRGISEVLGNNQSLEARVNSQEERITQIEIDLEATYQVAEKQAPAAVSCESSQTQPDQFASGIGYLKEIASAIVGISRVAGNNQSLEETVKSQNATIQQLEKDLEERNALEEKVKSQTAKIQQMEKDLEARHQIAETETEIKAKQKEIDDEENQVQDILETSLERSIITMASFFVAYHSLLAYSQQPKNDLLRFILIMFLIAMIWGATIMLLVIWWLTLQGIGERIISLNTRRLPSNLPAKRSTTLKWHLLRSLIVFLGIFATGFSLYFVCITYSLWSTTSSIASPPSTMQLLPTILEATQESFSQ